MATIHDVAARAGVSTATVSRALNGKETVDPVLVARVVAAARELDYQPNAVARNLRRQATAVWALIISDIENPFFTAIARGLEDVAQTSGFFVVLCNADESLEKERDYLQVAVQERVAGVVISPTSTETEIKVLVEHNIPVIAIDRPLSHEAADTVLVDTRESARHATTHLVEQGYQRVACITGPRGVQTADDRLAGYRDAVRAAGRSPSDALVRYGDFKVAGGRLAADQLFAAHQRPDALLVANALMAVGALQTLHKLGLRCGREVGVVSFDDAPWTELVDPPLTTVNQPAYDIGRRAGELLLDRTTEGDRGPQTVTLEAELVVRGSSLRS